MVKNLRFRRKKVKNLRFRRKKVKFWQKVLLIWHPILKTEGDPNTHDNAYYQSKSWKFLTKIDENQRKMTKNDEKKGKNDFFSSFFVIWTQKFQKIRDRGSACSRDRVFLYNKCHTSFSLNKTQGLITIIVQKPPHIVIRVIVIIWIMLSL
jgi:hypothetical protein